MYSIRIHRYIMYMLYIHIYAYENLSLSLALYIYTYIYIYMYIYIYIYIYTHIYYSAHRSTRLAPANPITAEATLLYILVVGSSSSFSSLERSAFAARSHEQALTFAAANYRVFESLPGNSIVFHKNERRKMFFDFCFINIQYQRSFTVGHHTETSRRQIFNGLVELIV